MDYFYMLIRYAVLAALLIVLFSVVRLAPRWGNSAVAPHDYRDMRDIPRYTSVRYDASVGLRDLRTGDQVVLSLGDNRTTDTFFAWVGALPGQRIGVRDAHITVDGNPLNDIVSEYRQGTGGRITSLSNGLHQVEEIVVPAGLVFVVSDGHRHDSIVHGLFPPSAIRGRITSLRALE